MPRTQVSDRSQASGRSQTTTRTISPLGFANAISFDGTNDAGTSGTTMTMGSATKMSLYCKIRLTAATPGTTIIFEGSVNANVKTSFFLLTSTSPARALEFYVHRGTSGSTYSGIQTRALTQNQWYTLVFNWNKNVTTNQCQCFVDGSEEVFSRPLNGNVDLTLTDETLYAGARGAASLFAKVDVKQLRVWAGKNLTVDETLALMNHNVAPTLAGGETLVAQYNADEGTGTTLAALGNSPMDMTLAGSPAWITNVPTGADRTQIT